MVLEPLCDAVSAFTTRESKSPLAKKPRGFGMPFVNSNVQATVSFGGI